VDGVWRWPVGRASEEEVASVGRVSVRAVCVSGAWVT
jgi:hypothetical protein